LLLLLLLSLLLSLLSLLLLKDVQRIAILDIRLCNLDRNSSNMVVRQDPRTRALSLIPIDHGLCLPDCIEINWYSWEWLKYPQIKLPILPHLVEYVNSLDVDADIQKLRSELKIREVRCPK
jgi:hypothetical protein